MSPSVEIDPRGTSLEQVAAVLDGAEFTIGEEAVSAILAGREKINSLLDSGRPIYGVNTGFGRLAGTLIPRDELALLQRNLLLSHACATGEPLLRRSSG